MDSAKNIRRNSISLTKFEPISPRKIHFVNPLTSVNTMINLIGLVSQKTQFVIETKSDYLSGTPRLIQILFAYQFKLHIILVETTCLPSANSYLNKQIASLFSIILSPFNIIQSYNDIKTELENFVDLSIFTLHQIEKIHVVDIQQKFKEWYDKNLAHIKMSNFSSGYWTLEEAMVFLFRQDFDTHLFTSYDWDIGLFAKFNTDCDEKLVTDNSVLKLLVDNKIRLTLTEYAVHECMAVNKIATLLQNSWTRKHAENDVRKYYKQS